MTYSETFDGVNSQKLSVLNGYNTAVLNFKGHQVSKGSNAADI